jgi:hypothetical protein
MQKNPLHFPVTGILAALLLAGCASTAPSPERPKDTKDSRDAKDPNDAYLSTYKPMPSGPVVITNATILTAAGDRIERGSILMQDGRIAGIGGGGTGQAPAGAPVVDGAGKLGTSGLLHAPPDLVIY